MTVRRTEKNGSWTPKELEDILSRASPYVRHFLWEVSQHTSIPSSEIKSPNAASAILKRLANNAGKEPLLLRSDHTGQPTYSLNPNYRSWITELVADAHELPESKPPRPQAPQAPQARSTVSEASTHSSVPRGSSGRNTGTRTRATRAPSGDQASISMPEGTDLNFCRDLAEFLNAPPKSSRYRIVLDEDNLFLEKA